MRRLMLVPVLALVVLAPTGVQAAEEDLLVCDEPPAETAVIEPNQTLSSEPVSPQLDAVAFVENEGFSGTYTDVDFQLDLYPATATDEATITSTLTWELDLNDWDLYLLDEEGTELDGSEGFQFGALGDDPPTETVSSKLLHCSLFTIRIFNYQAVALDDFDPLQLEVTTGAVL
jgi:hypothetical protein